MLLEAPIQTVTVAERKPQLTLFPQMVKSEATVDAVFAIEWIVLERPWRKLTLTT